MRKDANRVASAHAAGPARPLAAVRTAASAAAGLAWLLILCLPCWAAGGDGGPEPLYLFGIPVDFILFALTLLGVALFHHHTLQVALAGLAAITLYKLALHGLQVRRRASPGLAAHMAHEWVILANLFLLLMGFALLSRHFEKSQRARRACRASCPTTGRAASCCW